MIMSPVQINTAEGNALNGVLIEGEELAKVIGLIDRSNADGLKGEDALLVMKLKAAGRDLTESVK